MKKLLILAIIAILICALLACGNASQGNTEEGGEHTDNIPSDDADSGKCSHVFENGTCTNCGVSEPEFTYEKVENRYKITGNNAFSKCSSLESITIPASTLRMGECVFMQCTKLRSIRCEAASQPSGRSDIGSLHCSANVQWG